MAFAAVAAAAVAATSVYQGQRQEKLQKQAIRQQEQLNAQANIERLAQRRQNEMEMRRVNRRKPDVEQLLFATENTNGYADDLLTGPGGVAPSNLKLGGGTPLGI